MGRRDKITVQVRKVSLVILKFLVSAVLLYLVISKTGMETVASTLRNIRVPYFLFATLIYILSIYMSTIRWRLLLPGGFNFRRLLSLYLIGSFFNNLLPGIIGGDAVKAYYLSKELNSAEGHSASELPHPSLTIAIASVFMDRYIGFTALMFIGLMAFPFGFRYFKGSYIEWILPLLVIIFIIGSFFIFGLRIGRRFSLLSGFYDYFGLYRRQRTVILKTFIISISVQITGIFAVYAVSRGLNVNTPLLPLFMFIPIISAISTIPISISGIGVREASFVLLFGFLGIGPAQATAISLSWFLSVALGSLLGLGEYLRYKNKKMSP
ncbi:MAG: lysylphosphatidylglycerol synthase transmembrane domain-containing protein [Thermodesulfovibrionales bacterium]